MTMNAKKVCKPSNGTVLLLWENNKHTAYSILHDLMMSFEVTVAFVCNVSDKKRHIDEQQKALIIADFERFCDCFDCIKPTYTQCEINHFGKKEIIYFPNGVLSDELHFPKVENDKLFVEAVNANTKTVSYSISEFEMWLVEEFLCYCDEKADTKFSLLP